MPTDETYLPGEAVLFCIGQRWCAATFLRVEQQGRTGASGRVYPTMLRMRTARGVEVVRNADGVKKAS